MDTISYNFEFLTPGFAHGAYQGQGHNQPELRGPSLRGQIRWWHEAIFGSISAGELFGALKGETKSTLVTFRPKEQSVSIRNGVSFIPHKHEDGGQKNAIAEGSVYSLDLIPRRQGLSSKQAEQLRRSVEAWLLLGGVGQRSNRAGGSVWPKASPPSSEAEFNRVVADLLTGSQLKATLLSPTFDNEFNLRYLAGDFLDANPFLEMGTPFGSVSKYGDPPRKPKRKPSPLKLSAARIDGMLRMVAVWDARFRPGDLKAGVHELANHKDIGRFLEEVIGNLVP